MKKILIIKAGSTFEDIEEKFGGFDKWVEDRFGVDKSRILVCDVEKGEELPPPESVAGAVMTGSHNMVTEKLGWSEKAADWIRRAYAAKTPFLGICYGHQLIAQALGGEVGYNPKGREVGTVEVVFNGENDNDPLFNSSKKYPAHVTHSQTVIKLPDNSVSMAKSDIDDNQVLRVGECMWGVQFHPEFNEEVTKEYIRKQSDYFQSEGISAEKLLGEVKETPEAEEILKKFAKYCFRD